MEETFQHPFLVHPGHILGWHDSLGKLTNPYGVDVSLDAYLKRAVRNIPEMDYKSVYDESWRNFLEDDVVKKAAIKHMGRCIFDDFECRIPSIISLQEKLDETPNLEKCIMDLTESEMEQLAFILGHFGLPTDAYFIYAVGRAFRLDNMWKNPRFRSFNSDKEVERKHIEYMGHGLIVPAMREIIEEIKEYDDEIKKLKP
ncbi:hypothetical protein JXB27_02310 [Candidatus Woesearchaeota archaeon]|nr:hypothetical protein [Candidatus Woesearchaeota archaeon]